MHAERRIISYSVKLHRRYQNNICITRRIVGENIEGYWNVDVEKEVSNAWTGLTRLILLNERPPDGYTWSRRETYEETNNLSSRQCMARYVEASVWCSKKESKTKMGDRETKARQRQIIKSNILH